MDKETLKRRWQSVRERGHLLRSIPDARPVLKPSVRPVGSSGVFFYKLSVPDYVELADRWFADRNRTFRANFVEYVSQVFSELIEAELLPDGSLTSEKGGTQLYAPNLKRISRNYSLFNTVLVEDGWLEVLSLHDTEKKKCRTYGVDHAALKKGVERSFLTVSGHSKPASKGRIKTSHFER